MTCYILWTLEVVDIMNYLAYVVEFIKLQKVVEGPLWIKFIKSCQQPLEVHKYIACQFLEIACLLVYVYPDNHYNL